MNCIFKPNTKWVFEMHAWLGDSNLIIQEKQKVRATDNAQGIYTCQKWKENCVKKSQFFFLHFTSCLDLEFVEGGESMKEYERQREKRKQIRFTNLFQFSFPSTK